MPRNRLRGAWGRLDHRAGAGAAIGLVLLSLALVLPAPAPAAPSVPVPRQAAAVPAGGGIEGLASIQTPDAAELAPELVHELDPAAFVPAVGTGALSITQPGTSWWRIETATVWAPRVLAVYDPGSARVTAVVPPGHEPRTRALVDEAHAPGHSRRALTFELPAGTGGPLYLRVDSGNGRPLRVAIVDAAAYAARDFNHARIALSLQAVLVTVALIVALFWLRMRESAYLLFAANLSLQALYLAVATGTALEVAPLRWLAELGERGEAIVALAAAAAALMFVREFVQVPLQHPGLSRLLGTLAGLLVLLALPLTAPFARGSGMLSGLAMGGLLLSGFAVLWTLLASLRVQPRAARIALLAWLPLLLVSPWQWLQAPAPPWLDLALPLSMAHAAIVLCFGLADRMSAIRSERDVAVQRAEQDGLTQTLNRGALMRQLDRMIEQSRRGREPVSVLFMDLDHFKQINDQHGHAIGDACLGAMVEAVESELRNEDLLGRYGGEEFAVLLPGAGTEHAAGIAERIRRHVEQGCRVVRGRTVNLTVSIGVAELHRGRDTRASLVERADEAMYAAKSAGRNRVKVAVPPRMTPVPMPRTRVGT